MHLVEIHQNLAILFIVPLALVVQELENLRHCPEPVAHGHGESDEDEIISADAETDTGSVNELANVDGYKDVIWPVVISINRHLRGSLTDTQNHRCKEIRGGTQENSKAHQSKEGGGKYLNFELSFLCLPV